MIYGIGTDIIAISRIKSAIEKNPRFVDKIFSPAEILYCQNRANPYQSYAARFAAKEAVMKAIGTGWDGTINWIDIEIINDEKGAPQVLTYNDSLRFITQNQITRIFLSLSHEKDYAIAYAILERA